MGREVAALVQTEGERKRELTAHLRTRRQRRKAQAGGARRVTLGITDEIRISQRQAEAEDQAVPGHWEGDLLLGGTGQGGGDHARRGSCSSHPYRIVTPPR